MVVSKETENGTSQFTTLPRPNTNLLEDTGVCLRKAPRIEVTPEGYTYEAYELTLKNILACSTSPKAGNNLIWNENERYFAYSVQNILVFEDLNEDKTQSL